MADKPKKPTPKPKLPVNKLASRQGRESRTPKNVPSLGDRKQ
jgi:hypothetical protein